MCRFSKAALCAFTLIAVLATPLALAEKPSWAGAGDKSKGAKAKGGEKGGDGGSLSLNVYFDSQDRRVAREYFDDEFKKGHCPPGLAKKNNGCMPPGQAKKWSKGRPLPRDVVYYDVPYDIAVRIGLPPEGHKLVRVAADILLIAVGTGMVVDAIEDLSSM